MFKTGDRILLLSPHPEDIELGMGATIAKLHDLGADLEAVIFSDCQTSLPASFTNGHLFEECKQSLTRLGLSQDNIGFLDFPVRRFSEYRQEILDELIRRRNSKEFTAVFIPSTQDIHQDHHVLNIEAMRAFKSINIFGYELPWNNMESNSNFFSEVNFNHVTALNEALAFYKSQSLRPYFEPGMVESRLLYNGLRSGTRMAEPFQLIRGFHFDVL